MGTAATIAAVGIGVGAVGSIIASENAADATTAIGKAQLNQARESQRLAIQTAKPTADELTSINRLIETQDRFIQEANVAIERERQILEAVDPAIQEIGKQTQQLLEGKEAASLAPIRRQREKQRQAFEKQMSDRLGSGWRTSSAGIEASVAFDTATSDALLQAQEQSINRNLSFIASTRPDLVGDISRVGQVEAGIGASILGAQQNISARQVNAVTGTANQLFQAAGGEARGDLVRAQGQQQLFGDVLQAGTTVATFDAMGGFDKSSLSNKTASGSIGGGGIKNAFGGELPVKPSLLP